MKTTQQHNIDRVTEKIPAPEIVFNNKLALRRHPTGLRRTVIIATSGVAATIAVILGTLLGSPSPEFTPSAPLPTDTATLAAKTTAPDTLPTQPATPSIQKATPKSLTAEPKTKTWTQEPTQTQKTENQAITPIDQPDQISKIAQTVPPEPIQMQACPQIERPQTQIETPRQPTQSDIYQSPPQQVPRAKSAPEKKNYIGQLIADVRERPKKARNLSAQKLDPHIFENPNLIGLAEGLRNNKSKNHLVELFSKK